MKSIGLDTICIEDLSLLARVGCTAEERSFPQRLVADIKIALDLAKSSASGNLEDSVCYVTLKETAVAFLAQSEWKLLEQLTSDLSHFILEKHLPVQTVKIKVKKFVFSDAQSVSIEMTRSR